MIRDGIYSVYDSFVLDCVVRGLKPKTILDLGPREGGTTSVILNALIDENVEQVTYYLFEKDIPYLESMMDYCNSLNADNITFIFGENIIDYDFSNVPDLDMCFIDGNHDYILARWYVDTLFPLVKNSGITHIHDVYFGKNGNGWEDVGFQANPQNHPDIISPEIHKRLYPSIFSKYSDPPPVELFEEDIIKKYCIENQDTLDIFSTCFPSNPTSVGDRVPNCALYIFNKKYDYFTSGT